MIVQITMGEKTKSVGVINLNLIDFIDQANAPTKNGSRQSMLLEKCLDKRATVEFTVRSVLISANYTGAETISMGSDGIDSGPESEIDFGDIDKDSVRGRQRRGSNRGSSMTANAR